MHVRGPGLERLEQQQVDELDDGRLVRQRDEVVERGIQLASRTDVVGQAGNDILGGERLRRVDAADRGAHVGFRVAHQLDGHARDEAEVVERLRIDFLGPGRDQQAAVVAADREQRVVLEVLGGERARERAHLAQLHQVRGLHVRRWLRAGRLVHHGIRLHREWCRARSCGCAAAGSTAPA